MTDPLLERVPGKCGGAWTIARTRIPVLTIWQAFVDGWSVDTIMTQWPSPAVTREAVEEAVRFATKRKPRRVARMRVTRE